MAPCIMVQSAVLEPSGPPHPNDGYPQDQPQELASILRHVVMEHDGNTNPSHRAVLFLMELRADLDNRHFFVDVHHESKVVTRDIDEAMHMSKEFLQSITDLDGPTQIPKKGGKDENQVHFKKRPNNTAYQRGNKSQSKKWLPSPQDTPLAIKSRCGWQSEWSHNPQQAEKPSIGKPVSTWQGAAPSENIEGLFGLAKIIMSPGPVTQPDGAIFFLIFTYLRGRSH